jgi:hypothetical protein
MVMLKERLQAANEPVTSEPEALLEHMSATYFSLRMGLAVLAFAFPPVMYFVGKFVYGIELQPSLSAYFWAAGPNQCASFPMRTFFVGFLIAIGSGLYLYKGFTKLENVLLNIAGICGALVALFPMGYTLADAAKSDRVSELFANCPAIEKWASADHIPIHGASAITLFVLLAIVAWFCAYKTLEFLPADQDVDKWRHLYRFIAILMLLCPATGFILTIVLHQVSSLVFFIEAAGVWTFGAYWAVKSRELHLSALDTNPHAAIARKRARAAAVPKKPPGTLVTP